MDNEKIDAQSKHAEMGDRPLSRKELEEICFLTGYEEGPESFQKIREIVDLLRQEIDASYPEDAIPKQVEYFQGEDRQSGRTWGAFEFPIGTDDTLKLRLLNIFSALRIRPYIDEPSALSKRPKQSVFVIDRNRDLQILHETRIVDYAVEKVVRRERTHEKTEKDREETIVVEREELRVKRATERELRIEEIIAGLPERPDISIPERLEFLQKTEFSFRYGIIPPAPSRAPRTSESPTISESDDPVPIDSGLSELFAAWDLGGVEVRQKPTQRTDFEYVAIQCAGMFRTADGTFPYIWKPGPVLFDTIHNKEISSEEYHRTINSAKRYQSSKDGRRAMDEVIKMNVGLVVYTLQQVLAKHPHAVAHAESVFSQGLSGLEHSLPRLDLIHYKDATAYMKAYIEGYMRKEARRYIAPPFPRPPDITDEVSRFRKVEAALASAFPDRARTPEELMAALLQRGLFRELSRSDNTDALLRRLHIGSVVVAPEELDNEPMTSVTFQSDGGLPWEAPELRDQHVRDLKRTLRFMHEALLPRELEVLRMHFGMRPDGERFTQEEIRKALSVSKERIRQIEENALKKLRHENWAKEICDQLGIKYYAPGEGQVKVPTSDYSQ